jgi:hypothetical protein
LYLRPTPKPQSHAPLLYPQSRSFAHLQFALLLLFYSFNPDLRMLNPCKTLGKFVLDRSGSVIALFEIMYLCWHCCCLFILACLFIFRVFIMIICCLHFLAQRFVNTITTITSALRILSPVLFFSPVMLHLHCVEAGKFRPSQDQRRVNTVGETDTSFLFACFRLLYGLVRLSFIILLHIHWCGGVESVFISSSSSSSSSHLDAYNAICSGRSVAPYPDLLKWE